MIVAAVLTITYMRSLRETPVSGEDTAALKPSKKGVIITIAREHGSSGKQIGKLVAERPGIRSIIKK